MAADRYSKCVRCEHTNKQTLERLDREVLEKFGELSPNAHLVMRRELADREGLEELGTNQTFREDWEFVTPEGDGELRIIYSGSCSVCGFNWNMDEIRQIWSPEEDGGFK